MLRNGISEWRIEIRPQMKKAYLNLEAKSRSKWIWGPGDLGGDKIE